MFNRKLEGFVPKEIEKEVYDTMYRHYKDYPTFGLRNMKGNNIHSMHLAQQKSILELNLMCSKR